MWRAAALALATGAPGQAQDADGGTAAVGAPAATLAIPEPRDVAYPAGTIHLDIDASDVSRGEFKVTQTIPVTAGTRELILLFPQWLPGHHAPRGPLPELVGLQFLVDGKPVTWSRDTTDVYAFHVELPAGTRSVTAKFINTSPLQPEEGRIVMTPDMLNLQWEKMSLYPAGHFVRRIKVKPTVTLPPGWDAASALDGKFGSGNRLTWAETDYETLVDSPIFAGANFRKWDLGGAVTLNVVADSPDQLQAKSEQIAPYKALVNEAVTLFGSTHYDHYEFLLALSERLGRIGLEHHRSSENRLDPEAFTKWSKQELDRGLLPHELVHSWNGKFRRPARLWTPDYRRPMQPDLLWVYEGQSQFWGFVLAARSGLQSPAMVLGQFASNAGAYAEQPGRAWRSIADTTLDPIIAARRPKPYATLARGEDYYNEGALIWLEVDQILRARTGGDKGLDDFAKAFFGIRDGDRGIATYTFDDVVAGLNAIHAYDWTGFFKTRIDQPGQAAPLGGIESAGYKLVWRDVPNVFDTARMEDAHNLNLTHSLGVVIGNDGEIEATQWGGPAFAAGIVNGMKIIAVNGVSYDADRMKRAITVARNGGAAIEMIVRRGDRYSVVPVKYTGGLRWPWLERKDPTQLNGLDRLLQPRRPGAR